MNKRKQNRILRDKLYPINEQQICCSCGRHISEKNTEKIFEEIAFNYFSFVLRKYRNNIESND